MKFSKVHSRSTLWVLAGTLVVTMRFPSEAQPAQPLASPRLFHLRPTADRLTSGPSWQAGVDIGTVHLLDLLVPGKAMPPDEAIAKFQHTFVLRNETTADIQVDEVQSDCGCTTWSFDDPVKMKTPFSVASGTELKVTVSINPQAVGGGAFQHSVTLVMKGQVAPLSQMSIQGYVDNGVAVNNGAQPERTVCVPFSILGSGASRHVVLNLDRRLPQYFSAGVKLRLVTTNDF